MLKYKKIYFILFFFVLNITGLSANAQQLIINVPNASVLPKGKAVIVAGADGFKPYIPHEHVNLAGVTLYGVGHNTEILGGVWGIEFPNEVSPALLLGVKKVFNITEYTKLTLAPVIFPDLAEDVTPFNINFVHLSQEIPRTKTRFTGGIYLANAKSFLPGTSGAILGFEQPLFNNRLILVSDWISRNEPYGIYAAGVKTQLFHECFLTSAVEIPNGKKGRFAFVLYIAKAI